MDHLLKPDPGPPHWLLNNTITIGKGECVWHRRPTGRLIDNWLTNAATSIACSYLCPRDFQAHWPRCLTRLQFRLSHEAPDAGRVATANRGELPITHTAYCRTEGTLDQWQKGDRI